MDSLPPELLNHIASYLSSGPRGALPTLAATSRLLRFAAEGLTFRRVRIRMSRDFAMFEQVFRKEEGWRRGVLREVHFEVEIGGARHRDCDNKLFTQGIVRLLGILREWELDGSGAGWGGASGAEGGIKLTIAVCTLHQHVQHDFRWASRWGYDYHYKKTLRLLLDEIEVEKILPKVRRIVGLDIIGLSCGNSAIEATSVVKLAARMPGLRKWRMPVPTSTSINRVDCDSDVGGGYLRTKIDFSQTLLQALCSPNSNTTTASFNSLTTFALSSLSGCANCLCPYYPCSPPHISSQREEEDGRRKGERGKDLLSQALHALSRLPNLEQFYILAPVRLSNEIFWPSSSPEGGVEKEQKELVPFWTKLRVLKVMFAAGRPGGGWYTASRPRLPRPRTPGYWATSPMFSPTWPVFSPNSPVLSPPSVLYEYVPEDEDGGGEHEQVGGDGGSEVASSGEGMRIVDTSGEGEEDGGGPTESTSQVEINYAYSGSPVSPNYIHPPMSLIYPPMFTPMPPSYNPLPTELIYPNTSYLQSNTFYPLMQLYSPRSRVSHNPSPIHILIDPTSPNPVHIGSPASLDSRQSQEYFQTIFNTDTFTPGTRRSG